MWIEVLRVERGVGHGKENMSGWCVSKGHGKVHRRASAVIARHDCYP